MKYLLLSLLTLNACASYTHRGINVYDKQVDTDLTQKQAEKIIDYAFQEPAWKDILSGPMAIFEDSIDQTDGFYAQFFEQMFDGWDFVFTSAWLGVPLSDGRMALADGMTIVKDKVVFLKVHDCYGDSAILHEIGHVVRQHFGLPEDREHKDYEFWMIMKWMEDRMIDHFCPENYQREPLPQKVKVAQ